MSNSSSGFRLQPLMLLPLCFGHISLTLHCKGVDSPLEEGE
ncbi:hypothetical protein LINPERHAP2_LOCUS3663, partial [Linum perenne]